MIQSQLPYHLVVLGETVILGDAPRLFTKSFENMEQVKEYLDTEIHFPVVHCYVFHGPEIFRELCKS